MKLLKIIVKILTYLFVFAVLLSGAVAVYLNTISGKNLLREKIGSYLHSKLNTNFSIVSIDFHLPNDFELTKVYVEDQHGDSLLYAEKISIRIALFKLISGETDIKRIGLKNTSLTLRRQTYDSLYNYQFILDAFAGKKTKTISDTSVTAIRLQRIQLDHVNIHLLDSFGGSNLHASLDTFDASINTFQPDKLQFDANTIIAYGIRFNRLTYRTSNSKTSSAPSENQLIVTAGKIDIHNLLVDIQDQISGLQYANNIHDAAFSKAILDLKKEDIRMDKFSLNRSDIRMTLPVPEKKDIPDSSSASVGWKLSANTLVLNENTFSMDRALPYQNEGFDPNHIALTSFTLHANDVNYTPDSMRALITHLHANDRSGFSIDTLHANIRYNQREIIADELFAKTPQSLIKNVIRLQVDDTKALTLHPEHSVIEVELVQSTLAFNDLTMLFPSLKKSFPSSKFRNQIMHIDTRMKGSLQRLDIPFLQLSGLRGSNMKAKAVLFDLNDVKKIQFDITLLASHMTKQDAGNFMTLTPEAYRQLPPFVEMTAKATGSLYDMIFSVNMKGTSVRLDANARFKHIDNPSLLQYDAAFNESQIERNLLLAFIPEKNQPTSIELPALITLAGKVSGNKNNIYSDMHFDGSFGSIRTKGYVKDFSHEDKFNYDLIIETNQFELGKLLKQDSLLSVITMSSNIKGRGYEPKTLSLDMKTKIATVGFNKYPYQHLNVTANAEHGLLVSAGNIDDQNLKLSFEMKGDMSEKYPTGDIQLHIDTARLHALHLTSDTLNVSLKSHIRIDDLSPDNVNALFRVDSIRLTINQQHANIDSIVARATGSNGRQHMTLRSPMIDANANGVFQYKNLYPSFLNYINGYYHFMNLTEVNLPPQQIVFDGIIREDPFIKTVVKGLGKYDSISFKGSYASNATDSALNLIADIPSLHYNNFHVASGKINILSANQQVQYTLKVDTFSTPVINLFATNIAGFIGKDTMMIDGSTKDEKGKTHYAIGATVAIHDGEYTLRLKDKMMLNYQNWSIAPDNSLSYSPKGFNANHFTLTNNQSSISAQSEQTIPNSPINISITDFAISTLTSLLNKDTMLANGIINAKLKVSEFDKTIPAFEGNMTIRQLIIKQDTVGTLTLNATKENEQTIAAEIILSENENDAYAKGKYFLNNTEKQFDADILLNRFNLAALEGFTKGIISDSKGSIDGKIKLSGKFSEPHWNGVLNLKDPSFRLTKFGTLYKMTGQKITLNYPDILLDHFTILDSNNKSMVVNGKLHSTSMTEFDLDMTIHSKDFIIVNTPKAGNAFIYGFAAVNTDVNLTGNTASPDIEGSISLNDNTDVTVVLPEKNVSKEAARSVVRFIDTDTFALPEKLLFVPNGPEKNAFSSFINYNLNVDLSPKAALTVVIDPSTGDELKFKGDAKLSIGVDPGGNILLAGNYNLDQGHYILHYQFLERQFTLLSGSTIAFAGDPMDAQVNIQAEYIANTTAIDLVGNELGDVNDKTANTFNQRIPFRVLLFMKGTLKKLEISFDIQLPDENQGLSNLIVTTVKNKLTQLRADPSAINKQVFSLLVLNRFVGEQSTDFFKGNDGGVSDIARQSVSKFLSAALDQIASDLIKGVDIDLNLNSYRDYSSGDEQQRTDLNIGVTKRFMDDRLSISVGKNLGVEGQDKSAKARQQNSASYMPDATINYKLSKDGKYMIRAYSKNKFEVIMDGYVVETGLSFILTMDYEKFKEMFSKSTIGKK